MSKKFVLEGVKVFATLKKAYYAGVEYSEEDVGTAINEKNDAGVPYFTEVGAVSVQEPVIEAPITTESPKVAEETPAAVVSTDLTKEDVAPHKSGKTISVGRKATPPAAPEDTVVI